jgi:hypothetical protein
MTDPRTHRLDQQRGVLSDRPVSAHTVPMTAPCSISSSLPARDKGNGYGSAVYSVAALTGAVMPPRPAAPVVSPRGRGRNS